MREFIRVTHVFDSKSARKEIEKHTTELESLIPMPVSSLLPRLSRIAILLDPTPRCKEAIHIAMFLAEPTKASIDAYIILDPKNVELFGDLLLEKEEDTIKEIGQLLQECKATFNVQTIRKNPLEAVDEILTQRQYDLLIIPALYSDVKTDYTPTIINMRLICEHALEHHNLPLAIVPNPEVSIDQLRKHIGFIVLDPDDADALEQTALELIDATDSEINMYFIVDKERISHLDYFEKHPDELADAIQSELKLQKTKAEQAQERANKRRIPSKYVIIDENIENELSKRIKEDHVYTLLVAISPPDSASYQSSRVLEIIRHLDFVGLILVFTKK